MQTGRLSAFTSCIFSVLFLLLSSGMALGTNAVSDTENCLLCHRYPSIGRYDEITNTSINRVEDPCEEDEFAVDYTLTLRLKEAGK